MNIQNLSTETIQRLITLAIEASPTKAAHILLENVIVPEKIVNTKPIVETTEQLRKRRNELINILGCANSGDRVGAIKYLRQYSGMGLKQARDTIESLNQYPQDATQADSYWVGALKNYNDYGDVVLSF